MALVASISPTQDQIFAALGAYITAVLPAGVAVIQGQVNRVPEPSSPDFVVMWPLRFPRLSTNVDSFVDAAFTGSISGSTMTIAAADPDFSGKIAVGSQVFGVGVTDGTVVTALGTGTGGVGTYVVSPSQTVASETLATGTQSLTQSAEFVAQLDVHGPRASDNAQTISTTLRDPLGAALFAASGFPVTPLHADDPRQAPFIDAEQQYENRLIVEAHLQVDQIVVIGQQFASTVALDVVDVDVTYPPS